MPDIDHNDWGLGQFTLVHCKQHSDDHSGHLATATGPRLSLTGISVVFLFRNMTMTAARSGRSSSERLCCKSSSHTCCSSSQSPAHPWVPPYTVHPPFTFPSIAVMTLNLDLHRECIEGNTPKTLRRTNSVHSLSWPGAASLQRADLWGLLTFPAGGEHVRRGRAAVRHQGHHDGWEWKLCWMCHSTKKYF